MAKILWYLTSLPRPPQMTLPWWPWPEVAPFVASVLVWDWCSCAFEVRHEVHLFSYLNDIIIKRIWNVYVLLQNKLYNIALLQVVKWLKDFQNCETLHLIIANHHHKAPLFLTLSPFWPLSGGGFVAGGGGGSLCLGDWLLYFGGFSYRGMGGSLRFGGGDLCRLSLFLDRSRSLLSRLQPSLSSRVWRGLRRLSLLRLL